MNARPVRLLLLVLLVIASAQGGVLDDVTTYTNTSAWPGFDTPQPTWTLVILLFDSSGAVTDISTFTDITNLDLSTAGPSPSYLSSTSSASYYADEPLASLDGIEAPTVAPDTTGVPEPATFVLFGLGAAALIWYRRR